MQMTCHVSLLLNPADEESERFEYYPEELEFPDMKAIPQGLLLNIIEKYRHMKEYCKWCYYKNNKQVGAVPSQANKAYYVDELRCF